MSAILRANFPKGGNARACERMISIISIFPVTPGDYLIL